MSAVNFCKFHGFGNDYIVIEKDELAEVSNLSEFSQRICHRNSGVGSDGIAVLEKLENQTADYSCRIINPDGSEAGFSGNGTRCAVAYLHYKNLWQEKLLKLQTKSGIKTYKLLKKRILPIGFSLNSASRNLICRTFPALKHLNMQKKIIWKWVNFLQLCCRARAWL